MWLADIGREKQVIKIPSISYQKFDFVLLLSIYYKFRLSIAMSRELKSTHSNGFFRRFDNINVVGHVYLNYIQIYSKYQYDLLIVWKFFFSYSTPRCLIRVCCWSFESILTLFSSLILSLFCLWIRRINFFHIKTTHNRIIDEFVDQS